MIGILRNLLLSIASAALVAGLGIELARKGAMQEIVRLAGGMLMIAAILLPLRNIPLPIVGNQLAESLHRSQITATQEEQSRKQLLADSIGSTVCDSVERRIEAYGFKCSVHAEVDPETISIKRIAVTYPDTASASIHELQQLLIEECGIPLERQEWIQK